MFEYPVYVSWVRLRVRAMQTTNMNLRDNRSFHQPTRAHHARARFAQPDATDIAADITRCHGDVIDRVHAIFHHPRSLARPLPTWRPPGITLPAVSGCSPLRLTVTRHRVGPRAKARVRGFGETREPAYLITARLADPSGGILNADATEGWICSFIGGEDADAVHEFSTERAASYVWLVDRNFRPVHSPISMFTGLSNAA